MIPNKMLLRVVGFVGIMILAPLVVAPARDKPSSNSSKPWCQSRCGDLTIPYPFGIRSTSSGGGGQQYGNGSGSGCYFDDGFDSFLISCNKTNPNSPHPSVPYLANTQLIVSNISLENLEVQVMVPVLRDCYNLSGDGEYSSFSSKLSGVFSISTSRNKFTAIECDTFAMFQGSEEDDSYSIGCTSLCRSINDVLTEGSCSGIGCCQTSIPRNTRAYSISLGSYYNHSKVLDFNPCSFAFVSEIDYFNFSFSSLYNMTDERVPLVYDWVAGRNGSCMVQAKKDPTATYLSCGNNTHCRDNSNGQDGYRCYCKDGYAGNPYLPNGCQDIDECATLRPCNMTCSNLPGSFTCSCPKGFQGDGLNNGIGCRRSRTAQKGKFSSIDIALCASSGLLFVLLCTSLVVLVERKRKVAKEKKKFFRENGGLVLQRLLSEHGKAVETLKVFNAEELKKATGNYHESKILGEGGQGTVYKGTLMNNRKVAIKKAKMVDRSQIKEFINEVIILSQINHKNVVKLIGCCLETEYPSLVYEFFSNGTLSEHLQNDCPSSSISSWEARLRIAAETSGALSYLHSDTSIHIVHRDVKSANILLDGNYTAKVSDFGVSRLMPQDQAQLSTLVQGTLGYLDPEYFQTSQLTDKSDVYSFGVVLAELLTGLKAVSFFKPLKDRNLSIFFLTAVRGDWLLEIVDKRILNNENVEQIKEVAVLGSRCLSMKGEDRPSMKEVALELQGLLRTLEKHPWMAKDVDVQENEILLKGTDNRRGRDGVMWGRGEASTFKSVSF